MVCCSLDCNYTNIALENNNFLFLKIFCSLTNCASFLPVLSNGNKFSIIQMDMYASSLDFSCTHV